VQRSLLAIVCACALPAFADEAVAPDAPAEASTPSDGAAARTDSTPERSVIEEIVVVGDRDDLTLKDTSHSVAVFTTAQLRLGTEHDMTALYQRVPNVTTDPRTGAPTIRGIARNGINVGGFSGALPTSGSYEDGYFTPMEPNLWDARQAEVQRGPESFVSGGAMAGLDAVMTNDPTEARQGRADVEWSPDANDRITGVAYGGPLSDTLGYRFAGYARSSDGFTSNPSRGDGDWDSGDDYLGRLKLAWRPNDDPGTTVRLRAEKRKLTLNGDNIAATFDPNYDPFRRRAFDDADVRNQEELSSLYLELDRQIDARWRVDSYVGVIEHTLRADGDGDGFWIPFITLRSHQDRDFVVAQVRTQFDGGDWQASFRQFAAYLDLTNGRTDIYWHLDYDGPGPGLPGVVASRLSYSTPDWWFIGTQFTAHRSFGNCTVDASLLRTGQVLDADRRVHAAQLGSTGNPADDAIYDFIAQNNFPHADHHYHLHDFLYLPTVDFGYALNAQVNVGAKYERAGRLGGVWFNPARGTPNAYHDEISDNFDLYIRTAAFDDRFTLRANLFYARIRNQQIWVGLSDTDFDRQFVNAQRSHNDGIEVEATWSEGALEAWLSLGLLEAQFDRIEVGDASFSGNDFPDAPPWTVSTGLTYVAARGWFAEIDVTARPQTRGDLENHPSVTNESRQIVNARLGWAFAHVEASLFARNLLDDEYLNYHDTGALPGSLPTYIPGNPREIGMTVSVAL